MFPLVNILQLGYVRYNNKKKKECLCFGSGAQIEEGLMFGSRLFRPVVLCVCFFAEVRVQRDFGVVGTLSPVFLVEFFIQVSRAPFYGELSLRPLVITGRRTRVPPDLSPHFFRVEGHGWGYRFLGFRFSPYTRRGQFRLLFFRGRVW